MTIHQVWLSRYHSAFGQMVAFDRAAACGDEAGLVGFDCFDAVREGWREGERDEVSDCGSCRRKRRWELERREGKQRSEVAGRVWDGEGVMIGGFMLSLCCFMMSLETIFGRRPSVERGDLQTQRFQYQRVEEL